MPDLRNVFNLLYKEFISLWRDRFLLGFVLYAFTLAIYMQATGISHELHRAAIGIVDNDRSQLSNALQDALLPPRFQTPVLIGANEVDRAMDSARFTFVLDIPENFEADVLSGRSPSVQLLIDATALMQAGIGATELQNIFSEEVAKFVGRGSAASVTPINLQVRIAFNQSLETSWFTGVMGIINNVTMLSVILAGAALIREREHGTLEHILVLPVRPSEIMLSKIIANGIVILTLTALSILTILQGAIGMKIAGSLPLFLVGAALFLFFATSLGIFLGTMSGSMAQMGLLFILTVIPMNMLSGGVTPLESMPHWLQTVTQVSPSTQFVAFAQAILYRGAGLDVVWPHFTITFVMGMLFYAFSLMRFRAFLAAQQ